MLSRSRAEVVRWQRWRHFAVTGLSSCRSASLNNQWMPCSHGRPRKIKRDDFDYHGEVNRTRGCSFRALQVLPAVRAVCFLVSAVVGPSAGSRLTAFTDKCTLVLHWGAGASPDDVPHVVGNQWAMARPRTSCAHSCNHLLLMLQSIAVVAKQTRVTRLYQQRLASWTRR
jgi:hypothetical protein